MRVNNYILFFLAICFFSSCSNRPFHVLSEKKMENVLYDVYLADAAIRQNATVFNRDSLLKEELFQSVLNKHRITQEELDASLLWYNSNLDKYTKINERLMDRYTIDIDKLNPTKKGQTKEALQVADTTILFSFDSSILSTSYRENIFPFLATDYELLNKNRKYYVDFLPLGIKAPDYPILSFNIECQDTILTFRDTIKNNTWYTNSFRTDIGRKINSIYGSIYLPTQAESPLWIHEFTITQQQTRRNSDAVPAFSNK